MVCRVLLCPFQGHQGQCFQWSYLPAQTKERTELVGCLAFFWKQSHVKQKFEGIQRGLTTGGTCYYTHTSAGWRLLQALKIGECPHPSPDVYSVLIIFKTNFINCFLRQGSVFLVTPGTRINPPRGGKRATRNLELVFGGRIVLAITFIVPELSLGCVLPPERDRLNLWSSAGSRDVCNVAQKVIQPLVMLYTTSLPDASTP